MPAAKKPTREAVLAMLEKLAKLPQSKRPHMRGAAASLGTNDMTLGRYLRDYAPLYGITLADPFGPAPSLHVAVGNAAAAELEAMRRERDRIALERDEYRKRLRATAQDLAKAERLREFLFGITNPALSVPKWTVEPGGKKSSPHIPVLFASDFQWGEVIRAGNMGGLNEFNSQIAERRYRLLIDRAVDISLAHLPRNKYAGIVYLRGGDMISGEIHADLAESNDLKSVPAVRSLVAVEQHGIEILAETFGKVYVISVPGNHGRTTHKPQSKRGAIDNFDTLSAWWLESIFKGDPRVSFYTPESGDAVFNIFGDRYLLTHGDRIGSRGGEGFVGPAATITRGMKRTTDVYAKTGVTLAGMFVGHFHVALELEYGWSNGSLPGYSEYARDGRMTPAPPEQWLIYFHPRYGATSRWPILLEPKPKLAADQEVRPFHMEQTA